MRYTDVYCVGPQAALLDTLPKRTTSTHAQVAAAVLLLEPLRGCL